jgi:hypothetical protein
MVAMLETALRLNEVVYAPYYALFIVGPSALLIEIWFDWRKQRGQGLGSEVTR